MALKEFHRGHVPEQRVSPGATIATLAVGDTVVATYCDGADLPAVLAPRPFLHPVTTLGGVPVTDEQPEDHRWHLGISVTLQDVGGANVWGGRTYLRDAGYTWLADHGRQVHTGWADRQPSRFSERLEWQGPDGDALLTEDRRVRATAAALPGAWLLHLTTTLTNATPRPLPLGSPATNGRSGAGYGGFFWRLPAVSAARAWSPDAEGEDTVHGSVAPWVAVTAEGDGPFTVAVAGADDVTRRDPWFVRLADYPGLGSQLAAGEPVVLPPGGSVTRTFRVLVADGAPSAEQITRALEEGS
jgi:hypothetical protein